MFSCKATQRSTQALSDARGACVAERFTGAHPSQQSWAPSVHKATDGHAFRRHMRPELSASQGFAHAFIPSGVDSRGFPSSLLYRDLSRYACIFLRKSLMVFCMRQVMVIGPTPPGTGVITDAIGSTAS